MKHYSAERDIDFNWMIRHLESVEKHRADTTDTPLIWQMKNVPKSEKAVTETTTNTARLCGTLMGLKVFRHRVFYCNYACDNRLSNRHEGKLVGSACWTAPARATWQHARLAGADSPRSLAHLALILFLSAAGRERTARGNKLPTGLDDLDGDDLDELDGLPDDGGEESDSGASCDVDAELKEMLDSGLANVRILHACRPLCPAPGARRTPR